MTPANLPSLTVDATCGSLRLPEDVSGRWLVLYFYPKDNTPGCTTEGLDFSSLHDAFAELNARILGVSRDSLRTHANFRAKQGFLFDLISDPDEALCQAFGVIKPKKLYGKTYLGVERSTFLIDPQGVVQAEWRGVKVAGHAQAVLERLQQLQSSPARPDA